MSFNPEWIEKYADLYRSKIWLHILHSSQEIKRIMKSPKTKNQEWYILYWKGTKIKLDKYLTIIIIMSDKSKLYRQISLEGCLIVIYIFIYYYAVWKT